MERLLTLTQSDPQRASAYLRPSGGAVVFPPGRTTWVSIPHARDIVRLLLLAKDADAVVDGLQRAAVTGWESAWDVSGTAARRDVSSDR
jgi:hypothetical protein